MKEFNRGIKKQDFINALNELYKDKNSFWHKMLNDKELFVAIRDNYINVYYFGASLCKLDYTSDGVIRGQTHRKYLGIEEDGHFESANGKIIEEKSKIKSLTELTQIKGNANKYVIPEKRESYNEILNTGICVIDVETTLVKKKIPNPIKKSDYESSSLDYLVSENDKLVFYEAKHINNKEIRSRTTPKVLVQIARYEEAIKQHEDEIISSYKLVCQNLNDLHISKNGNCDGNLIGKKICIELKPRLIIFDIDNSKKEDKHILKLKEVLGDRLLLKYKN